MFFSPDILTTRESGFGLLWLAATLGSKSNFKKLNKRSVLTADISKLCGLIAEPAEPLALRLSSNLMVGVARVYKVKQEIFMTDVTTCFNTLKKVVQEIHSSTTDAQLQMAQPSVRPGALTLATDSNAFVMDFDNLVADWDEYLNINEKQVEDDDEDFDPKSRKSSQKQKGKGKGKPKTPPLAENLRADLYTLKENHDHLLSASFDESFLGSGSGNFDPSSSQMDNGGFGFGFDDNFLEGAEGFDLGIGDELARELGEDWGATPAAAANNFTVDVDTLAPLEMNEVDMGMDDFELGFGDMAINSDPANAEDLFPKEPKNVAGSIKENIPPSSFSNSDVTPGSAATPMSFSQQVFSQEVEPPRDDFPIIENHPDLQQGVEQQKAKRLKLLLDSRTELTDDELRTARSRYMEGQEQLRRENDTKRLEKESSKILEDLIWGIPQGFKAQDLVDFWSYNFKVQIKARSALHIDMRAEPPKKRRKIRQPTPIEAEKGAAVDNFDQSPDQIDFEQGMDTWMGMGDAFNDIGADRLRSSEEPGQGRQTSRPPSVLGSNFGFEFGTQDAQAGSQRSSLFPWDHAGVSSSADGAFDDGFGRGSDRISVDRAEVQLRRSHSGSRRASSLVPSHIGSGLGVGFSPAPQQLDEEDFAFDLSADKSLIKESQQSDNLITLERNSFNFLEYAKMQLQTLPCASTALTFDTIVPTQTSTRRVAATGFYHCLVLATKDLIHLSQPVAYGSFTIAIP